MIFKKYMFFILLAIFLSVVTLYSVIGADNPSSSKITHEVYTKLQQNDHVSVIIKTKHSSGIALKSLSTSLTSLQAKANRVEGDLMILNITTAELANLGSNPLIEKIGVAHHIHAFLQDLNNLS